MVHQLFMAYITMKEDLDIELPTNILTQPQTTSLWRILNASVTTPAHNASTYNDEMTITSTWWKIGTAHCRMSYQNAFFEYIRYDVRDRERESGHELVMRSRQPKRTSISWCDNINTPMSTQYVPLNAMSFLFSIRIYIKIFIDQSSRRFRKNN